MRFFDASTVGPNPRQALQLIDRLGLYQTIFADPGSNSSASKPVLVNWRRAYDQAEAFVTTPSKETVFGALMNRIQLALLKDSKDVYSMWLLCAFVPWARVMAPALKKASAKAAASPAGIAAREGIKADNNSVKLIENAAAHLVDIIQVKDAVIKEKASITAPRKRKQSPSSREALGMAIRRWGSRWRCSVMFAIMTQTKEVSPDGKFIT